MYKNRLIFQLLALLALGSSTPLTAATFKIAVIADLNGSYGSKNYSRNVTTAIDRIRKQDFTLVLSAGDMVAGQKSGLDYQGMWNAFHDHVTRPLAEAQIPLLPSPGNHDAAVGYDLERQHYAQTWASFPIDEFNSYRPAHRQIRWLSGVAQNYPFNYAVTVGSALIVSLDATAPGGIAKVQMDWLEQVLALAKNSKPKIIFGHIPLLPFAFHRAHEHLATNPRFGILMEELLDRHQVDLLISGHHHVYYQGLRRGATRFISTPLLGSGARTLLTKERTEVHRSPEGYIEMAIDDRGSYSAEATEAPTGLKIPLQSLPPAISVPNRDTDDCRHCAQFPSKFFLNPQLRTLYNRI